MNEPREHHTDPRVDELEANVFEQITMASALGACIALGEVETRLVWNIMATWRAMRPALAAIYRLNLDKAETPVQEGSHTILDDAVAEISRLRADAQLAKVLTK